MDGEDGPTWTIRRSVGPCVLDVVVYLAVPNLVEALATQVSTETFVASVVTAVVADLRPRCRRRSPPWQLFLGQLLALVSRAGSPGGCLAYCLGVNGRLGQQFNHDLAHRGSPADGRGIVRVR